MARAFGCRSLVLGALVFPPVVRFPCIGTLTTRRRIGVLKVFGASRLGRFARARVTLSYIPYLYPSLVSLFLCVRDIT